MKCHNYSYFQFSLVLAIEPAQFWLNMEQKKLLKQHSPMYEKALKWSWAWLRKSNTQRQALQYRTILQIILNQSNRIVHWIGSGPIFNKSPEYQSHLNSHRCSHLIYFPSPFSSPPSSYLVTSSLLLIYSNSPPRFHPVELSHLFAPSLIWACLVPVPALSFHFSPFCCLTGWTTSPTLSPSQVTSAGKRLSPRDGNGG